MANAVYGNCTRSARFGFVIYMNGSAHGEISFFKYVSHVILNKIENKLPYDVLLLTMEKADLSDPAVEPVGIYYYAGILKCIWRDKHYSQVALNSNIIDLNVYDDNIVQAITHYSTANSLVWQCPQDTFVLKASFTKAFLLSGN